MIGYMQCFHEMPLYQLISGSFDFYPLTNSSTLPAFPDDRYLFKVVVFIFFNRLGSFKVLLEGKNGHILIFLSLQLFSKNGQVVPKELDSTLEFGGPSTQDQAPVE